MADIKYYGLESHFNENVTFYKDVNINGNLNYDTLTVRNLNVKNQSNLAITTATSLSTQSLSVSEIAAVGPVQISSGIITSTSGIATYYGDGSNLQFNGNNITSLIPAGTIISYASTVTPVEYLKCNGAAISRSTYSSLFSAIGTTYGSGDGSTTFNLPDLRGEFIRGLDDGRGVDSGRAIGSAQADDLKSHTHTGAIGGFGLVSNSPLQNVSCAYYSADTGSTGGTETRPRNVALLYCIKY